MIVPEFPEINWISNRIHEWGQPEQHLLRRVGLTRLASVACMTIEILAVSSNAIRCLGIQTGCLIKGSAFLFYKIFPRVEHLKFIDNNLSGLEDLKKCIIKIAKIIAGIASTVFFGLVFSPEVNFRLHIMLGLAVDNLTVKKEKQLKDQLEFEAQSAIITIERAKRFAKFQKEIAALKNAEMPKSEMYPANLADVLVPKRVQ